MWPGSRTPPKSRTGFPAKPNGNSPRAAAPRPSTGGASRCNRAWPTVRTAATPAPNSRQRSAASSPTRLASTTWAAGSISGSRIAGTRPIRAPRRTARPGLAEIARRMWSAPAPGGTMRAMCGRPTETATTPMSAIRPTACGSRCRPDLREDVMKIARASLFLLLLFAGPAHAQNKPAPKDAVLYFVWPQNGTVIKGGFWARFGLRHMGVTHAGDNYPNAGHHHLLIDVNEPLNPKEPIPSDKSHMHFGAGQTEARIELPPGKHTLQLVLGDADHYPFNPPIVSEKITIAIK